MTIQAVACSNRKLEGSSDYILMLLVSCMSRLSCVGQEDTWQLIATESFYLLFAETRIIC